MNAKVVFKNAFSNLLTLCLSKNNGINKDFELENIGVNDDALDKLYESIGIDNFMKSYNLIKNSSVDYTPSVAMSIAMLNTQIWSDYKSSDPSKEFLNEQMNAFNMLASFNQYQYDVFANILFRNNHVLSEDDIAYYYDNYSNYEPLITIVHELTDNGSHDADINDVSDIALLIYEYDYDDVNRKYNHELTRNVNFTDNIMIALFCEFKKEFIDSHRDYYFNPVSIMNYMLTFSNPDVSEDDEQDEDDFDIMYEESMEDDPPSLPKLAVDCINNMSDDAKGTYLTAERLIELHKYYAEAE